MITTVQARTEPATERIRLQRREAVPVTSSWHQDGELLRGQVAFSTDCQVESVTVTRRTETRKPNPVAKVAPTLAIVGGAALAALGVGAMAASRHKHHEVVCGNGEDPPRDGDRCSSEAGAWVELGAYTAALGVLLGAGGVAAWPSSKSHSSELPPVEAVTALPDPHLCGSVASLAGAEVVMEVPGGAHWLGEVDADGSVRIDLTQGPEPRPGTLASFSFGKLPPGAPVFVTPGLKLGELVLGAPRSAHVSAFLRKPLP